MGSVIMTQHTEMRNGFAGEVEEALVASFERGVIVKRVGNTIEVEYPYATFVVRVTIKRGSLIDGE